MVKRKRLFTVLAFSVVLLAVAAWFADARLKKLRHPGLGAFIQQLFTNYPSSFKVEPLVLSIKVDEADLERLQQVVDDARERGVIMPEGRDYVPAEITGPDGSFKAKIRIKGKMTDHVKGDKWSFRVVAKKDGGFLGMRRFSLQHPGTRNYINEWIFHELSKGEGFVALRYGFLRVEFNGEDLGIYAFEEHFGPELLEHNNRLKGPLFRFDPSLFWEHRLNSMQKLRFEEAFASYQAASLDAFGSGDLLKDSVAMRQFEEASGLMEAFRRGKLSASEVFDADLVARRHALLDVLGGHHSMDFSDVKFYYDPLKGRIEPVAYESFSVFPVRSLAGSGRYTGTFSPSMDLHDAYFNDPVIFRAYVHHLERMARPSYLDSAFKAMQPALDSVSAIVYQEFPWKEPDRQLMERNQRLIRKILDVPKGFHAYQQSVQRDTVELVVVPIESLPMEVHALVVADRTLLQPATETIIPVRAAGMPGKPQRIRFALTDTAQAPDPAFLKVRYSVLGASVMKDLEVFPQRWNEGVPEVVAARASAIDPRSLPFLVFDEEARSITFKPGEWTLATDLHLPAGYTVHARSPLRLDLVKGARISSASPLVFLGQEEMPVVLRSSDASGATLLVESAQPSRWEHVRLEPFGKAEGPALAFHGGGLELNASHLGGDAERDLLLVVGGVLNIKQSELVGGRDQLVMLGCKAKLTGLSALGAGDEALVMRSSVATLLRCAIEGAGGGGIKLNAVSQLDAKDLRVEVKGKGIELSEGSEVLLQQASISSGGIAIDVRDASSRYGASVLQLEAVRARSDKELLRSGEGNRITGAPTALETGRKP